MNTDRSMQMLYCMSLSLRENYTAGEDCISVKNRVVYSSTQN